MAWDSSRPVPYRRLLKEWLIYAAVMIVLFLTVFRSSATLSGIVVGLVVSLPLWLGISYVLAKFGYQRKTYRELRAARTAPSATAPSTASAAARPRPAPTRRTSTGPNRPKAKRR